MTTSPVQRATPAALSAPRVRGAGRRVFALVDELERATLESTVVEGALDVTWLPYAGAARRGRADDVAWPAANPLLAVLTGSVCDVVVLGQRATQDPVLVEHVLAAQEHGVQVQTFTTFMEMHFGRVPARCVTPTWFLPETHQPRGRLYRTTKRTADLVGGLLLLALLLVLGGPIALAVKACSPGPVLFRQRRTGFRGQTFDLVKFRTMRTDAELYGPRFASPGDDRVHAVGRLLRRARLDELPQALLVLRGTMSLIGPRPERPEFGEAFAEVLPHWHKRHWVRPGITGWAQVHEGYGVGVQDAEVKLERDLYYMKHHNLRLDASIAWRTARLCFGLAGR